MTTSAVKMLHSNNTVVTDMYRLHFTKIQKLLSISHVSSGHSICVDLSPNC